jgi:hypothetical protein
MVDVELMMKIYLLTMMMIYLLNITKKMVDRDQYLQMKMSMTNQQEVTVMIVILGNRNPLNELVLKKVIFALAIENTMIETMTTNHRSKLVEICLSNNEEKFLHQSSNSSAKYR